VSTYGPTGATIGPRRRTPQPVKEMDEDHARELAIGRSFPSVTTSCSPINNHAFPGFASALHIARQSRCMPYRQCLKKRFDSQFIPDVPKDSANMSQYV